MQIIKIEGFVFQTLITRCCAPAAYSSCCCTIVVLQLGSSIQEGIHRTRFIGYGNYASICIGTAFSEIVNFSQLFSGSICKLHIGFCFNFLLFQFYCIEIRKISNAIHLNCFQSSPCFRREVTIRRIDYLYRGCDITCKVIEI